MTDEQRLQIKKFRAEGYSYGKVAQALGLSENTVKTFCKRNGLGGNLATTQKTVDEDVVACLSCGSPIKIIPGRKEKKFCSDKCRNKWWNAHLDKVNKKANYDFECAYCKKPFIAYGNSKRKYCSHECYIADRFGGGSHE